MRKQLADGTVKEYRYPPHKPRADRYGPDSIGALVVAYKISPEWTALAENTRTMYGLYLREIERLAATAVADITRRDIIAMRNAIASTRGFGAATGFIRAVSVLFGWAVDNEWIDNTPVTRMKKLPGGHLPAWTPADAALAMQHLPEHLRRVVVLALYTGQRRGDLAKMMWSDYDGQTIRVKQQKTGRALVIPAHAALRRELDAWRAEAKTLTILADADGLPWVPLRLSERLPRSLGKIEGFPAGRNVHGLRKLAAANMADAGCTVHEIASITGHTTLSMVALYTASADQERLATAAIHRLQPGHTKNLQKRTKGLK